MMLKFNLFILILVLPILFYGLTQTGKQSKIQKSRTSQKLAELSSLKTGSQNLESMEKEEDLSFLETNFFHPINEGSAVNPELSKEVSDEKKGSSNEEGEDKNSSQKDKENSISSPYSIDSESDELESSKDVIERLFPGLDEENKKLSQIMEFRFPFKYLRRKFISSLTQEQLQNQKIIILELRDYMQSINSDLTLEKGAKGMMRRDIRREYLPKLINNLTPEQQDELSDIVYDRYIEPVLDAPPKKLRGWRGR